MNNLNWIELPISPKQFFTAAIKGKRPFQLVETARQFLKQQRQGTKMDPVNPGYEQPAIRQQPVTIEPDEFGPSPQPVQCSACGQKAVTVTRYEVGTVTWIAACVIFPFCPAGCCVIPFIIDQFKDVEHSCPQCKAVLGKYAKI